MSDEEHSVGSSYIQKTNKKNTTQVYISFYQTKNNRANFTSRNTDTENSQEKIVYFMPYNEKHTDFVSSGSMEKYQTSVLLY